ncbi:MAG TPA: hypothetical protein VEP90_19200 [Methylomirabilota bacterium]|nr:hypothetical protein [Methylomirabilota bacterium]
MKCRINRCCHRGGAIINPKNPQGGYIELCLHHQVELFAEFNKRYYNKSKTTVKKKLR